MSNKINWTGNENLIQKLSFPLSSETRNSYFEELQLKFDSYKELINSLLDKNIWIEKSLIKSVENCCGSILKCVILYHKGLAGKSYEELDKTINNLSKDVYLDIINEKEHLYRMRISSETIRKNTGMFHIPFDMRFKVDSQRFSIAGLPCLYLGSSHFICWYELNKPNFNNLYSSSYKTEVKLKFLDLTKDISFISETISGSDLSGLLEFYPITIACNFNTRHFNAKFNDEYIISNLLLQWVLKNSNINGIKYLSVKYCNNKYRDKLINYVLPPKNINDEKFCSQLSNLFTISDPASFAVLMYGPNPGNVIAFESVVGNDPESALLHTYKTTIFGRTEIIVKGLPHNQI